MRLVVSIIAFATAIGLCVFMIISISQSEVTINTDKAQGVYNLKTEEFNGQISGWSSNKGFGSAFEEIKAQATSAHTTKVAIGAGGTVVFLIIGSTLLISEMKARRNVHRT